MEPVTKKARLTDHFRVALKPRDLNVAPLKSKQSKPIEVITIGDESNHGVESKQQWQQERCDENKAKTIQQQNPQQQTLPLKLVSSFSQQQQQTQPQQQLSQHKPLSQQQPRQHLGPILLNNHSQAKNKGNRSSISSCNNNTLNNVNLNGNKIITGYLIKQHREPSPLNKYLDPPGKHSDVFDYDKTLLNNVCWEPHYAWDSFQYDRQQEIKHRTTRPSHPIQETNNTDEINQLNVLSSQRRAELVDWLVDIQINYDLDHEPLYMAVKLVDQYLMRKQVEQGNYELLFMVSMLIAAKFDERIPPITIAELIQVTRTRFGIRYTRKQVLSFEVDMLTTLQFDIRFPLSYGFLRRFARCTRSDTRTLYLARYILESSLMDQDMIEVIESKIAAGSLLLAFEMLHKSGAWDETAKYYTGYDEKELHPLVSRLNDMLLRLSKRRTSIRKKYSHEPYMEVARIPPLLFTTH